MELQKLRRDLDEQAMQGEATCATLRKKQQDAVNELSDQLDQLNKAKQKYVIHHIHYIASNILNYIRKSRI